jgi:hypothetical protein
MQIQPQSEINRRPSKRFPLLKRLRRLNPLSTSPTAPAPLPVSDHWSQENCRNSAKARNQNLRIDVMQDIRIWVDRYDVT